jgi:2-polyprenyl-6-methoxyphenol hydroxylase-like FAD-dependent oxidoreductase
MILTPTPSASSPSASKVLIVGAGPTGLTLALTLTRRGIPVRVFEKAKARSETSRALGVHAGTLELFDALFDPRVSAEMIRCGRPAPTATLNFAGNPPIEIDFRKIPSGYNFILILPQSETERVLEAELLRLGVRVEREVEFLGVTQTPGEISAEIRTGAKTGDKTEKVTADFLVGCDGAHSRVRESLGFSFPGGQYPGSFILADAKIRWATDEAGVRLFVSGKGAAVFFPFRTPGKYRLVIVPRGGSNRPTSDVPTREEIQAWLDVALGKEIVIEGTEWLSRFHIHHRMTDHYREGRVFLAGDAAHIHSPAGGQGMNIGIQDAANLGAKLAAVLAGKRPEAELARYESERRPIAKRVTESSGFILRMGSMRETALTRFVIRFILPFFVRRAFFQRIFVRSISEVGPARKEIERVRTYA